MAHINSSLLACFDPLQFANRHNRSTKDDISLTQHSSLEHLGDKDTYIKLLLIDYSSAFNTNIPSRLISKLCDLGLGSALLGQICNDRSKYRREIKGLMTWCNENNLSLNISKTKELIIYFRKNGREHAPIYINGTE
eukprot:g23232.t1